MAISGIMFVLGMLFMPILIAVALVLWTLAVLYALLTPVPPRDTAGELPV